MNPYLFITIKEGKAMKAGRLLAGELLFTRTQAFCKLDKPIPQDNGDVYNFMIIAGADVGKFAMIPNDFEGTLLKINLGESAYLTHI